MTPKEKAKELVNKYLIKVDVFFFENSIPTISNAELTLFSAKQCSLIAVDELINEQTMWQNGEPNPVLYWEDVKKEIEKL